MSEGGEKCDGNIKLIDVISEWGSEKQVFYSKDADPFKNVSFNLI